MNVLKTVLKLVAALAAIAGVIYVIATYGDKIVAWAKNLLNKCSCCGCDCDCEGDCDECDCEGDCDECDCECNCQCEAAAEEAPVEEVPAEEVPAEEAPAEEVPAAEETDFAE